MRPQPHPAKAVLAGRRILIREAAEAVRVNPNTLGRVLNGYEHPWPALRRRLSDYLELEEIELFKSEVVA